MLHTSQKALFWNEESGSTLVEYGVALIVAIVIGGTGLGALATSTVTAIDTGTVVVEGVADLGLN